MDFEVIKISDLTTRITELFSSYYGLESYEVADYLPAINNFVSNFQDGLYVGIEFPYVDKLYRSTYYNYYSSKLSSYRRDCIRLSFFSEEITLLDFLSREGAAKLQTTFLGFLVLRPNVPKVIGRNVLRPNIFKKATTYWVKTASIEAAINGVKLTVVENPLKLTT